MKHYSLVIILTIISIFCSAQQENLQLIVPQSKSKAQLKSSNKMDKNSEFNNQYKLETFVLDNGLTVYLNEDKNVPNIIGAVVIKTGGKYDPANATGTSHYLEHMMFKGNEIIGTTNYNEEKLILDEISKKYDELGKITDNEERKKIQKEINELSIKAGEFAIPNDLDKILDEIGSTFVNAFTSDEIVAYFNIFPSSQINKWLNVYSTRFQKPVFRLFQSELETVFEEKNMYADNMQTAIIENFYKNFYKNHPYGTQTVIGKPEHIKNPSQSTMQKMYDTYYVANNMALVLCGNFNSEEIKPLINKYFNDWRKGEIPKYPVYEEKPFNGEEIVKTRLAPIKLGIMGFRTVPNNSKDEIGLEICSALLNNSSETGLFDKLNLDGKIMGIYGMNDIRNDHGAFVIIYVPKILGQSHKTVKKLINAELEKLRSGNIDKEFFEAIKLNLIKEHEQELENFQSRAFIIGQMFVQNKDWRDIISYSKKVQSINIEDIQKIAGKYFNKNYLSFESKMGFPKKEKLEKPGFDPIIPKNTEAKSEYMAKFEQMPNTQIKPEIINFEKDALTFDINKNSKLYYVKQDINDIFKLNIKFHSGLFTNNKYSQLSEYLKLIGTKNTDLENFNKNLQKLGSTFSVTATNNDFIISIDGFNKNLRETMLLINDLITNPQSDEKKLKNLIQNKKFEDKFEKTDADNLSDMLLKFVMYEEKSEYLNRLSASEIKKIKSDDLLNLLTLTITKPCSIHYSGNLDEKELFSILQKELPLKENSENTNYPIIRDKKTYNENTIFFLDEPKAVQSKINFYISGNKNSLEERSFGNAFNQYFGAGMSSLIFQEIREFRSLAYSAFGNYYFGENLEKPGYFRAFIGTQSDKTIEAISIMDSLITQMPKKENRIKQIQSTLIQSINSNIPNKRQLSSTIEQYILSGYKEDPKILDLKIYENLNFDEIIKFYNKNIENRPIVITIVGNKKNINMENLAKFGKIIEVNIKQIAKN